MFGCHLRAKALAAVAFFALQAVGNVAAAQAPATSTADVMRILRVALDDVMPDSQLVSRVRAGQRGIHFDLARSLASFRLPPTATPGSDAPAVRAAVSTKAGELVADCSRGRTVVCEKLGWGIYSWLDYVGENEGLTEVRIGFLWVDRHGALFRAGEKPRGPGVVVGFAQPLLLKRVEGDSWQLIRRLPVRVW